MGILRIVRQFIQMKNRHKSLKLILKSPEKSGLFSLVHLTGLEPALLSKIEPNGNVTSVGLIPAPFLRLLYPDL